jgi:hypothetical protein
MLAKLKSTENEIEGLADSIPRDASILWGLREIDHYNETKLFQLP